MIQPTVGRVLWYYPADAAFEGDLARYSEAQPMAATVAFVWNERMVNLAVTDHAGLIHPRTSVKLLQDDDLQPTLGAFCQWMPYQKGQAAKTEQLEQQLSDPLAPSSKY